MRTVVGYLFTLACLAAPVQATTIVQSVTNRKVIALSNLSSGNYSLADDSFFNATFLPLINQNFGVSHYGSLESVFSFVGVLLSQGGGGENGIGVPPGAAYVNGALVATSGDYSNIFEIRYADSADASVSAYVEGYQGFYPGFDLLGASSLAVATRGSSPFSLTYSSGPGGILGLVYNGGGTGALTGTLTATQTLTYSFNGEGTLLATDIPEPATAALLGAGLLATLRRRRGA